MVSCKQCNTQNSLDSAFCKKCGAGLDAAEIALANDKLSAMIADGNRLFADGRTEDALMVAETAIASNPASAVAVSLKGMCLERKGMLAEALECFERVVELQPDSTLDKLKVNDLKNLLAVEKFEINRAPDRRMAVMGAFAATVFVMTCALLFVKANAKETEQPTLVAQNDVPKARTFEEVLPKQEQQPTQPQVQTNPQVDPAQPPIQQPSPNAGRERIQIPAFPGSTIPRPDGGTDPVIIKSSDLELEKENRGQEPPRPPRGNETEDPDPPVVDPIPPKVEPKNDPGIIEIEFSKGAPTQGNSGEGAVSGNGRTALIATARNQMMQGNYSAAASTYERALRAGADQGSTNQRLGQCYAQLGRNGEAVSAYSRAAAAFEKTGNTQAAEACKQAIKVLGG